MTKIKFYWRYMIYFLITQTERHCYSVGKIKGYNCIGYKDTGVGRVYKYDTSVEPIRDYITFDEYKKLHY